MVAPMSRFPPTSVTGRPPPLSCHASSSPSCHATSQPPNLGSDPSLSLPWRALARSDSLPRCTAVDVAARLSLRQSPPHASPSDASPSPSPALSPARPGSHARPSRRDGSSREPRCITIALPPSAAHGSSSITTPGRRGRRGGRTASPPFSSSSFSHRSRTFSRRMRGGGGGAGAARRVPNLRASILRASPLSAGLGTAPLSSVIGRHSSAQGRWVAGSTPAQRTRISRRLRGHSPTRRTSSTRSTFHRPDPSAAAPRWKSTCARTRRARGPSSPCCPPPSASRPRLRPRL
jgi:hypothetical protein